MQRRSAMAAVGVARPMEGAAPARGRRAFTVLELLAVMLVLIILSGIVLRVSGFAGRKSDISKARAQIERFKDVFDAYREKMGQYPGTNGVTYALTGTTFFVSTVLNNLPTVDTNGLATTDPWGNTYRYTRQSRFKYKLWSDGPDASTTNTADDISNEVGQ